MLGHGNNKPKDVGPVKQVKEIKYVIVHRIWMVDHFSIELSVSLQTDVQQVSLSTFLHFTERLL